MSNCVFCRIVAGELPAVKVHEDDRTLAIMDIAHANPGHVLVLPKKHAENIYALDEAHASALFGVATRLARAIGTAFSPHGLSVYQANGTVAGQQVFHFHVHLIPRYEGDDIVLKFPRKSPSREELEANASKIRAVSADRSPS